MFFRKSPKNEKWETIRKRELRNDIVFNILAIRAIFFFFTFFNFLG